MWVNRLTQPPCAITLIWPHIKTTIWPFFSSSCFTIIFIIINIISSYHNHISHTSVESALCGLAASLTHSLTHSLHSLLCKSINCLNLDKLWHLKEAWKKVEHLMRTQTLDAAKSLEEWNMTDSYNWHLAPDIWHNHNFSITHCSSKPLAHHCIRWVSIDQLSDSSHGDWRVHDAHLLTAWCTENWWIYDALTAVSTRCT